MPDESWSVTPYQPTGDRQVVQEPVRGYREIGVRELNEELRGGPVETA
jgi:hypothetical protein